MIRIFSRDAILRAPRKFFVRCRGLRAMLTSRSKTVARIIWVTWALGLCFVGYAASQSFTFTTWFAPVWIFLPLLFINLEQLYVCIRRSRTAAAQTDRYNKTTSLEVFVKGAECGNELQETCVICLNPFESGESIRKLPCGHIYHRTCIDDYFPRQVSTSIDVHTIAERDGVVQTLESMKSPICAVCRRDIFCPNV